LFFRVEGKKGKLIEGWGSRIIDRVWWKLRKVGGGGEGKGGDRDGDGGTGDCVEEVRVAMVNTISSPQPYKYATREELEATIMEVWVTTLRSMQCDEGGVFVYSLSYKRPTVVVRRNEERDGFPCSKCDYRGSIRDLRHHYCGAHGMTWNEAVMETMRFQVRVVHAFLY